MPEPTNPAERQSELERFDQEWEASRVCYMIRGRLGGHYVPSAAAGLIMGAFAVAFGVVWFAMAFAFAAGAPGVLGVFLVLGAAFVVVWVGLSVYQFRKARKYQSALAAYRRRRTELERRPSGRDDAASSARAGPVE